MTYSRRTVVAGVGALALGGCVSSARDGPGGTTEATRIVHRTDSTAVPGVCDGDGAVDEPAAVYLRRRSDVDGLVLPDDDHRRIAVLNFVNETRFEFEALVFVASIAAQTCYAIEVSDLAVDEGTLVARVTTPRTAPGDELCADAVTTPRAFVRLTFDGTPPEEFEITVVDGTGHSTVLRS